MVGGPHQSRRRKTAALPQPIAKTFRRTSLSRLEQAAVRPATQSRYRQLGQDFLSWALCHNVSWTTHEDLEAAAVEYMEDLYDDGQPAHLGSALLAALRHLHPGLSLPRAARAVVGWGKLRPPRQRLPIPRAVAAAIAGWMVSTARYDMAIAIMLSFVAYLRPHECMTLQPRCLIAPTAAAGTQYAFWGLVLNDFEQQRPGKTGIFDESVLIDMDQWLYPILQTLKTTRTATEPLWSFRMPAFRTAWAEAIGHLRLCHCRCSHCLASHGVADSASG